MQEHQPLPLQLPAVPDADLAERIRTGDAEAMNEVLRRYWSGVVDYVERYTRTRDAANDVAQDTFLQVWQGQVVCKRAGSLRSFLYGVARNLARNQGRRWQESRVISLEDEGARFRASEGPSPEEALEESELVARLERAVAALPARRQEIFVLARLHGFSYDEIASALDISPQTVANQMSAALADLRSRIGPFLG